MTELPACQVISKKAVNKRGSTVSILKIAQKYSIVAFLAVLLSCLAYDACIYINFEM